MPAERRVVQRINVAILNDWLDQTGIVGTDRCTLMVMASSTVAFVGKVAVAVGFQA